jgi:hypothetical protein
MNLGAAQWTDLNAVPAPFRKLNGARLSLEQINCLATRAVELGGIRDNGFGEVFEPSEGAARVEFMAIHKIEAGVWVVRGEP